jgi:hypothetical protein
VRLSAQARAKAAAAALAATARAPKLNGANALSFETARAAAQTVADALASSCLASILVSAGSPVSAALNAAGAPLPTCTVTLQLPTAPPARASPPPLASSPPPPPPPYIPKEAAVATVDYKLPASAAALRPAAPCCALQAVCLFPAPLPRAAARCRAAPAQQRPRARPRPLAPRHVVKW